MRPEKDTPFWRSLPVLFRWSSSSLSCSLGLVTELKFRPRSGYFLRKHPFLHIPPQLKLQKIICYCGRWWRTGECLSSELALKLQKLQNCGWWAFFLFARLVNEESTQCSQDLNVNATVKNDLYKFIVSLKECDSWAITKQCQLSVPVWKTYILIWYWQLIESQPRLRQVHKEPPTIYHTKEKSLFQFR